MPVQTVAGTEISISEETPASFDWGGYSALSFTEIGEITDGGSHGRTYAEVTHQPIKTRGTQKFKGSFNEGTKTLQLAVDDSDAGQLLAKKALFSDANFSFRVVYQDGGIDYFQAIVLSFETATAGVDSIRSATIALSLTTSKSGVGIVSVNPADIPMLFLDGAQGVWYDPSDLSTMFQDAAGTMPVTQVGQPVGLILDKRLLPLRNHAAQPSPASRPILRLDEAGRHYLDFDGIDDFLVVPAVDFDGTTRMNFWAGLRKVTDARLAVVLEMSEAIITNVGTFALFAPVDPGEPNFSFARNNGGYSTSRRATEFVAPINCVISCAYDVTAAAGPKTSPRVNGAVPTLTADGSSGEAPFGNFPIYIGRRGGTSSPFQGRLYSLVIRGAAASVAQIALGEAFVNSKTGAF